ncbi:MAG: L-threonylcarbamoyladenylate synthase, partial [Planctomycetota bacterium]
MTTLINFQKEDDPRDAVHRAVQVLQEGFPVAVPTETVFGLAANALDENAVQRLIDLKGRAPDAPFTLAVNGLDAAMDYLCEISPLAQRLAKRCWPGPITLVLPCDTAQSAINRLPESVRQHVVGPDGMVGFRVVSHRLVQQMHEYLPGPMVLTSANKSGQPPATSAAEITQQLGDGLPLIIDDGPPRYGGPSTVVRVDGHRYKTLREGVIEPAALKQFAKPFIAIVCTGNTCRSPMGEALLRDHLAKKFGQEDAIRVISAGVAAMPGSGASMESVQVMGQRGLDLTGHISRPLDDQLISLADMVLT